MKYEIRELGVAAILDQSIKLIQDNFKLLFGVVLALLVPYTLILGLVVLVMTPVPPPVGATSEATAAYLRATLAASLVTIPMFLALAYIIIPVTNAALVHAISRAYLQQPTSVGQAYQLAVRRLLPLIWTWFLMGLAIMGGLILLIIPGILALLWFAMATQIVILEGSSGFVALKRSKQLMKGNIGKLFLLGLLVLLVNSAVSAITRFVPQPHVQVALAAFVQGLTVLFSSTTGVIFYFSARCQHENFDLTLLAESVAAAEVPAVTEAEII